MENKEYILKMEQFVSTLGKKASHGIIRDAASGRAAGQKILERYLSDAYDMFVAEAAVLKDPLRHFEKEDSERLARMLDLLVEARFAWQEEEDKGSVC